ncbi:MAG: hypothetical protein ACTSX2_00075 [Candidatus Thorarchaeota archaeon]
MADPTVLELINNRLNEIAIDVKDIKNCQINLKITDEQLKATTARNELKIAEMQEAFLNHVGDERRHFNPYYNETYFQKIRRKKAEVGTSVSIGTILATVLIALLKYYGVM